MPNLIHWLSSRAILWEQDSPRGRQVPKPVVRNALASLYELAAWHAADQPGQAIGWYLKAARCRPFGISAYKGVLRTILGRK